MVMRPYFICLLLIAGDLSLRAQSNWIHSDGGENHDEALDIATNGDGSYMATGYFNSAASFGSFQLISSGFSDVFLEKVTSTGTTQWALKCGGTKSDRAVAVSVDAQGNSYITGYFTEQGLFGSIQLDQVGDSLEVFIAKVSPLGSVLWARACGGLSDDYSHGIDVDQDGNVLVTGQFKGQANFGPFVLTSDNYEGSNTPSYDVFVVKLDTSGNWLWAKKGSSAGEDRGLDVTSDELGYVYVSGQFSDTIVFDQVHNNEVLNAGFLIRYSPAGEEQWFVRFSASQVLCYDIHRDEDGGIYLGGDYIGQMVIFTDQISFVPYDHIYNLFLARINSDGQLLWVSHAGSDSEVSAKAIDMGTEGEVYMTGTFKCRFDGFSEDYGEGIFNSAGFRDVFIARFESDGTRSWERQFAGPADDFCSGIAAGTVANKPLIAGSFSEVFNIPSDENFQYSLQENFIPYWWEGPTCYAFCSDSNYPNYMSVLSEGNKDIFLTSPVSLGRQPYDIYNRSLTENPPCERPVVPPCAGYDYPNFHYCWPFSQEYCPDTVVICGSNGYIYSNENTGQPGYIGPHYNYNWSTGADQRFSWVGGSGWYSVDMERQDLCWGLTDSVYVVLSPENCPVITDSEGINFENGCQTVSLNLCFPDTVVLDAGNIYSDNYYWSSYQGIYEEDTVVQVTTSDYVNFNEQDSLGCWWHAQISIVMAITLDTISPNLTLVFNGQNVADYDTIHVCFSNNPFLNYAVHDLLGSPHDLYVNNSAVSWNLDFNGSTVLDCDTCYHHQNYDPNASGWYTMTAEPMLIHPDPCTGMESYPIQIHHVYVDVMPSPFNQLQVTGDLIICPGDSTLLVAQGAQSYSWFGPGPYNELSDDSVLVHQFGNYTVTGTSWLGSCQDMDEITVQVQSDPDPLVWMVPANGIVCPGDSVQLLCEEGLSYQWIGPLGELLDTTQTIWVTIPGYYFCIQTNNEGCVLESNFVEAKEYNSPFLLVAPGIELCVSGTVTLEVLTNEFSSVNWALPLYGSNLVQTIDEPGIYTVSVSFCDITTSLTVTITDNGTPAEIAADQWVICPGDTIVLTANEGMQGYVWQPGNIPAQEIMVTEPGIYSLTTFDQWGCSGNTWVQIYSQDVITPLSNDTIICAGESPVLTATSVLPVFWSSDPGGSPILSINLFLDAGPVDVPTTFYVFSVDSTCTSLPVEVQVDIYPSSIQPVITATGNLCSGGDLVFATDDLPGITYSWTLPDNSVASGAFLEISNANEGDSGWYFVLASDSNCESPPAEIYLSVPDPEIFDILFTEDLVLCEGQTIMLTSPVEAASYQWLQNGTPISTNSELTVGPVGSEDSGNYDLVVTGGICDYLMNDVDLEVILLPDIALDSLSVLCRSGYLMASLPTGYDSYQWSTGDDGPEILVPDEGWLWVVVTNLPDCAASDSMYIDNIDCVDDFVNLFTPNGDNHNETVDFGMLRIEINEVRIYNRWGNCVRHLTHGPFIWDGRNDHGEMLSSGNYLYVIDSPDIHSHLSERAGNIYLFKME